MLSEFSTTVFPSPSFHIDPFLQKLKTPLKQVSTSFDKLDHVFCVFSSPFADAILQNLHKSMQMETRQSDNWDKSLIFKNLVKLKHIHYKESSPRPQYHFHINGSYMSSIPAVKYNFHLYEDSN